MVVIDLTDPKVIALIGDKIRDDAVARLREKAVESLTWTMVSREVGVLAPCLMEQVHPDFGSNPTIRVGRRRRAASPAPDSVGPQATSPKLADHPAFAPIGSALIAACLVLAVPRARETIARRLGLGPEERHDKPRRYEE